MYTTFPVNDSGIAIAKSLQVIDSDEENNSQDFMDQSAESTHQNDETGRNVDFSEPEVIRSKSLKKLYANVCFAKYRSQD